MASGGDDIRKVVQEEKGRLRPGGKAAERKHAERTRLVEEVLNRGTEEDIIELIRSAGMEPASPEGQRALRIWSENRRR
jgi:hypothetical protein